MMKNQKQKVSRNEEKSPREKTKKEKRTNLLQLSAPYPAQLGKTGLEGTMIVRRLFSLQMIQILKTNPSSGTLLEQSGSPLFKWSMRTLYGGTNLSDPGLPLALLVGDLEKKEVKKRDPDDPPEKIVPLTDKRKRKDDEN